MTNLASVLSAGVSPVQNLVGSFKMEWKLLKECLTGSGMDLSVRAEGQGVHSGEQAGE